MPSNLSIYISFILFLGFLPVRNSWLYTLSQLYIVSPFKQIQLKKFFFSKPKMRGFYFWLNIIQAKWILLKYFLITRVYRIETLLPKMKFCKYIWGLYLFSDCYIYMHIFGCSIAIDLGDKWYVIISVLIVKCSIRNNHL